MSDTKTKGQNVCVNCHADMVPVHFQTVDGDWIHGWLCDCQPDESSIIATVERLAALEHEQWAHWTKHMLANLTPENVARWRRQVETPYDELSEEERESDRPWARKILAALGVLT